MAKLNAAQFTTAGLNAAADLFAHQKNNKISHMSISTTNYIGKDVSGLNKLTNEILVVAPSAMSQSGNVYTVTGIFDSSRVATDSTINSIGVYILDNSGLEVLLAVVTASQPDFIPAGGSDNQDSIVYDVNIAVANSGITFELTIHDNALAQMSDIADAKSYAASLVSTLDTTVVHNTGNEKISGTKTFLSTIIGSISGAAAKWANARKFITNLASNTAGSTDGSDDVTAGVEGILPVSNGGTGVGVGTANGLAKWNVSGTQLAPAVAGQDYVSPSGSITGNAGSATKLATGRTIGLSGDAIGTATLFDGTGNITIPVTMATITQHFGASKKTLSYGDTFNAVANVNYDNKGRLTEVDTYSYTLPPAVTGYVHAYNDGTAIPTTTETINGPKNFTSSVSINNLTVSDTATVDNLNVQNLAVSGSLNADGVINKWKPNTPYNVGDIVQVSMGTDSTGRLSGSLFLCILAHESDTTFPSSSTYGTWWVLMNPSSYNMTITGVRYVWGYDADFQRKGDVVTVGISGSNTDDIAERSSFISNTETFPSSMCPLVLFVRLRTFINDHPTWVLESEINSSGSIRSQTYFGGNALPSKVSASGCLTYLASVTTRTWSEGIPN